MTLRTMLFTPANHARHVEKALSGAADAVILALEDAIAIDEKPAARELLAGILSSVPARAPRVFVRVNALTTPFAYADLVFDGYRAPSVFEVPGAKDIAVEFFTLSKSYNMPGWRVGFMVGNRELVGALTRIKSYFDYGTFTPIQVASIQALEGPQECVAEITETYRKRRDALVRGLHQVGWQVDNPKATMFVWARIPEQYRALGSLEFAKKLLRDAKTAVSPGIGFGEHGDGHVRFSLIENEERTRQAIRGIRRMFEHG